MSQQNLINRWSNLKQPNPQILKCPICFFEDNTLKFKMFKVNEDMFHAGELIRYQCPKCDLIFGDLRFLNLSKEEIKQDYLDLYSYYNECDTTKDIYHVFKNYDFPNSKKYMDYACGKWNRHINLLKEENYDIIGFDPFVNYIDIPKDEKYDVIISNNFLEHLTDPYEDVKIMMQYLKEEGSIVFLCQQLEYCIENTHYHTLFFLGKSIDIFCKNLNMKLVRKIRINLPICNFTYLVEFGK